MKSASLLISFMLGCSLCCEAFAAFEPVKRAQPKHHTQPKTKNVRKAPAKKPDGRVLQAQAEANLKRHEHEARFRQFQQMQQSRQRAYQQLQAAQSANR